MYLESKNLLQENRELIASFVTVNPLKMIYESESDEVQEETTKRKKIIDNFKNACQMVMQIIKDLLSLIEDFIAKLFLSKEDKEALKVFEDEMYNDPSLKNKKVTVKDWKKCNESIDDAIREIDQQIRETKDGNLVDIGEFTYKITNILSDNLHAATMVITYDALKRYISSSKEHASLIKTALDVEESAISVMQKDSLLTRLTNEVGENEVRKLLDDIDAMHQTLSLRRLKIKLLNKKSKTIIGAYKDSINEVYKIANGNVLVNPELAKNIATNPTLSKHVSESSFLDSMLAIDLYLQESEVVTEGVFFKIPNFSDKDLTDPEKVERYLNSLPKKIRTGAHALNMIGSVVTITGALISMVGSFLEESNTAIIVMVTGIVSFLSGCVVLGAVDKTAWKTYFKQVDSIYKKLNALSDELHMKKLQFSGNPDEIEKIQVLIDKIEDTIDMINQAAAGERFGSEDIANNESVPKRLEIAYNDYLESLKKIKNKEQLVYTSYFSIFFNQLTESDIEKLARKNKAPFVSKIRDLKITNENSKKLQDIIRYFESKTMGIIIKDDYDGELYYCLEDKCFYTWLPKQRPQIIVRPISYKTIYDMGRRDLRGVTYKTYNTTESVITEAPDIFFQLTKEDMKKPDMVIRYASKLPKQITTVNIEYAVIGLLSDAITTLVKSNQSFDSGDNVSAAIELAISKLKQYTMVNKISDIPNMNTELSSPGFTKKTDRIISKLNSNLTIINGVKLDTKYGKTKITEIKKLFTSIISALSSLSKPTTESVDNYIDEVIQSIC